MLENVSLQSSRFILIIIQHRHVGRSRGWSQLCDKNVWTLLSPKHFLTVSTNELLLRKSNKNG